MYVCQHSRLSITIESFGKHICKHKSNLCWICFIFSKAIIGQMYLCLVRFSFEKFVAFNSEYLVVFSLMEINNFSPQVPYLWLVWNQRTPILLFWDRVVKKVGWPRLSSLHCNISPFLGGGLCFKKRITCTPPNSSVPRPMIENTESFISFPAKLQATKCKAIDCLFFSTWCIIISWNCESLLPLIHVHITLIKNTTDQSKTIQTENLYPKGKTLPTFDQSESFLIGV